MYLPAYRFPLFIFVHSIKAFKTIECRIINYLRMNRARWEVIKFLTDLFKELLIIKNTKDIIYS